MVSRVLVFSVLVSRVLLFQNFGVTLGVYSLGVYSLQPPILDLGEHTLGVYE